MADAAKVSQTMNLMITYVWSKRTCVLMVPSIYSAFLSALQMFGTGLMDSWVSNSVGSLLLWMELGPVLLSSIIRRRYMHV